MPGLAVKTAGFMAPSAFLIALGVAWTPQPTLGTVAVVGFCLGATTAFSLVWLFGTLGWRR
jgi:dienelactone hydrolase